MMFGIATEESKAGPGGEMAKALGAFYTDAQIADFLVWWAVRSPSDTALDPSFGGGVFLRSACQRLAALGGQPAVQVHGIEVDAKVHRRIADKLADEFGIPSPGLLCQDFFDVDQAAMPLVDVVVGNPPFIRYQRFTGESRRKALERAMEEGVRLTELSSSWAPFLVHSIGMLKQGGRLAMVVPMEIGYADYALPILQHLRKSFREVTFLTFRKKLFPDLSEDTVLLLADDRRCRLSSFLWQDLAHAGMLADIQSGAQTPRLRGVRIDAEAIANGRQRLVEYFIPKKARELYAELRQHSSIRPLRELADVGIGYVTGANNFFHLGLKEARYWGIPADLLRPAVRRSRDLRGLRFTRDDWRDGLAAGESGYLLHIPKDHVLSKSVRGYLEHGERQGFCKAYKCRTRFPWFSVPHVHQADAFLSYMSGIRPRLVANDADAVAPNTLHVVRLHQGTPETRDGLAVLWQTSLTRLSLEVEGHALGGGMLKLEPTEAENVLVACPEHNSQCLSALAPDMDVLLRTGADTAAEVQADQAILMQRIGLTAADCRLLRTAADTLRNRRYSRIPDHGLD